MAGRHLNGTEPGRIGLDVLHQPSDVELSMIMPFATLVHEVQEAVIEVLSGNRFPHVAGKPVQQERIDAGTGGMASADIRAPVMAIPVERPPVICIERGGLQPLPGALPQQPVLDEVGGQQRRAMRVQSLENRLRLIAAVEVEHDQAQVIVQRPCEGIGAFRWPV